MGIVQGLTEFLPVSSSGHLEIGNALFGVNGEDNLLFAVIVHVATALSTIIVFKREITSTFNGIFRFKWNESWEFTVKILISIFPVMVIGLFYADLIKAIFSGNLFLVGCCLMATSLFLYVAEVKKSGNKPVGYLPALIIGCVQALAVLPGISRSGSTIACALLLGVEKQKATQFSFLMVLIPILGAGFLEFKEFTENPEVSSEVSGLALALGFLAAFISGYLACRWMLSIVRKGKLSYFSIYCFVIGSILIAGQLL